MHQISEEVQSSYGVLVFEHERMFISAVFSKFALSLQMEVAAEMSVDCVVLTTFMQEFGAIGMVRFACEVLSLIWVMIWVII